MFREKFVKNTIFKKKEKLFFKNFSVSFFLIIFIITSFPLDTFADSKTVRQEINILNGTLSSAGTVESSERILLDTTKYSGSATYYFEAVYNGATSNTGTIKLSRAGTSTYDASINGATSTVYLNNRSSSFTPPAGQTEYSVTLVGDGVRTQTVKSARIVVVQNDDPLSFTETQIEIGNRETGKTNTSDSALTYPKYWKYNAADWDAGQTFTAETVWKKTNGAASISYVGGKGAGRTNPSASVNVALNSGLTGGSDSGVSAGDLVIVTVSTGTQASQPSVAVSGYTNLTAQRTTATTYDTNVQVSYKFMPSTPDTQVTIPGTGNNAFGQAYTIHVFRGVDPTTPLDGVTPTYATGTGVSNRPDPSSITPATSGAWIYFGGGGAAGTGGTYTAGYITNLLTYQGADTTDGSVGAGYYTGWSSGAYDGAAWTGGSANAANSWGSTTLVLRPAPNPTTFTAKLQEDNGSFGSWTDKVTIANAVSTDATTVRSRSAPFTPVDGRNYRIVTNQSTSNASYDIYNAKIINNFSEFSTSSFGSDTRTMDSDATYIYRGEGSSAVRRILKSDMSTTNTIVPGGTPAGITNDANYVYVGFYSAPGKVVRINKSDWTTTATATFSAGENYIYGISNDANYVYACTNTSPSVIKRIHKSDFSTVDTLTLSAGEGGCGWGMADDANYIYVGITSSPSKVVRINKSDFSTRTTLTLNDQNVAWTLFDDDNYVYAATDTSPGEVTRISKSDFSTTSTITLASGEDRPLGNAIDSEYLYLSTYTNPMKFIKIRLSDFSVIARTTFYGTGQYNAFGATVDGDYFYNGSLVNSYIHRFGLVDPVQEFETQYLLGNTQHTSSRARQSFLTNWNTSDWGGAIGTTFYHKIDGSSTAKNLAVIKAPYTQSFEPDAFTANPYGIALNTDGTKMFVVGVDSDRVHELTLSTPWDVTTASYNNNSLLVTSQDPLPYGLVFKDDGTKFWVTGDTNDTIYQYVLGTPWDITTASYDNKSVSVNAQATQPRNVRFKSDGTKMYLINDLTDLIHQYSLSTAWDVSTATYDNVSLNISGQSGSAGDLFFNSDGTRMIIHDWNSNGVMLQYTLSTPWNLSTASYDSIFADQYAIGQVGGRPLGIHISADGTRFYTTPTDSDSIDQYFMSTAWDIRTLSSENTGTLGNSYLFQSTALQALSSVFTMPTTSMNLDVTSSLGATTGAATSIYGSSILVRVKPPTVTVTLGDGTDPANSTIAPGASATEIGRFTLVTNYQSDTINNMTVTLAGDVNAYQNIATVGVYTTGDVLKCSATPSSNTVNLTSCGISVTTSSAEYKILITPKTHANMPAVPGASYATTATVTSITATNSYTGTDVDSATITVDNASPNGATSTSGTAGFYKVTLGWTASDSTDIASSVVLRWAASTPGAEVPVEGTTYTANQTITTATVACVLSSTASQAHASIVDGDGGTAGCNTSSLTPGQAYSYKVFQLDSRGNYDAGVTFTGSPFTPTEPVIAISGTSSGLSDGVIVRVAINGSLNANTGTINSNAWSISPTSNPTAGQSIVVFVTDGDGDIADNLEATAIAVYDGSGDMTGMSLIPGELSVGSGNSNSVTIASIDDYTCSADEDVMHSASAGVFSVQGCSNSYTGETIRVLSPNTFNLIDGDILNTEKIIVDSGAFFNTAQSPTINLSGTTGTLWTGFLTSYGTSTVNVTGNGDATFNTIANDFYNLTFSGTGTKTLGANITIVPSGTLTVSAGTFAPSTYTVTSNNSGQTLTVSSGATINVSASTFAGSYPGGWTNRNLNANSTVDYNLAGTQTVDGTLTYGNVTISGSGTKSLHSTTTMNGVLTVSGGTFDTTSQTLSVNKIVVNGGTFTPEVSSVNVTGNSGTLITISSGTFTPFSVGTLTLSGNGDATINSGSPTFYNLVSSGTGTKTLGANISVNGNLTVQGGGVFDPSTYMVSMIGGTVYNTDSTIRINGTTASGSFSGNSAASRSGTTYVQYARSGDQTVSSSSGYRFGDNLITSGSGIKTMGGSLSFETVQVGGSTTLALGSTTLTLNGTSGTLFTNNGSINSGTGTVKITSDSDATLFSGDFTGGNALYNLELSPALSSSRTYGGGALGGVVVANNFLIAPTGGSSRVLTYTMGGDNIAVGTLTIAPAVATQAVVSTTASDHITTLGYLNIGAGGTFNANGSSVSLTGTSGTLLTNNGTFTPGTSTLVLSGNGDASINTTTPLTLHNLTISSTGTKKGVGPLTIGGNLNINNANGAFHNGGQNLSVTGNITNSGLLTVAPVTEGWEYYRTITIDKTKVPSTVTDFPVLVSGTYTYLKTTGNAGKVRNANGYDVAFFADQALTQPLKFERVNWSATTGEVEYWVKVPAVSHLVDTVIYMAYGNTNITTDLSDRTNVWDSNFKGVYHLPDGTTLNTNDSTINANNATNTEATAISGKIDGGVGIIDSGDKLTITDISLAGGVYTISTWFEMPLSSNATGWNTLTRGINNDHQVIVNRANGELGMYKNGAGDFRTSGYDTDGLSNGWHHLVARTSGTTTLFYIDGAYVGTADSISTAEITTLGNYQLYTQPWGEIDELRISTGVSRSTDWITTEYNNQNNPATFYTIGNESTSVSPTVTVTGTVTNSGTFNAGTTDGDATAFLRATGITDPLISKAVGDLVTSAKLHGWWDKTDAIYPFVGGTADTHKYNLKDPRDADAAFRLTFNGGWTHDATGSDPNGTTGYAETNLVPSSVLSTNDLHVSYYSKQAAPSSSIAYEIGAMNNTTQELGLITRRTGDAYYSIMFDEGNSLINGTHTDGEGFFMGSRISSTSHNLYKDGVSMGSNNTANNGSLPTHEIYLAGLNLNGGLYGPSDKKVAFATIGDGINSTLAQRMYLDIEKFRDAVDRNDADSSITGPVISIAGTGTPWNNTGNVIAGNSTIKITDTGAGTKTFAGGGDTYNNLWFTGGAGGGGYIVSGNNTFNDFKDDGTVTHSLAFTSDSTQTMKTFSVSGANASNRITITSTGANNHNLIKTGTRDIESDFLVIEKSVALPSGDWYAGTSSVNNNSAGSGWRFNTPGAARAGGVGNAGGESSGGGSGETGGAGTCSDGQQNGNETGIDTGGRCSTGGGGGGAGGEGSGGGQGQTGGEGTCSDGIQNGNETGIDTGGRCSTGGGGGDTGYLHKSNLLAYAGGVDVIQILRLIFRF